MIDFVSDVYELCKIFTLLNNPPASDSPACGRDLTGL